MQVAELVERYTKARSSRSYRASREVLTLIDQVLHADLLSPQDCNELRAMIVEIDSTCPPLSRTPLRAVEPRPS